jgi:hypothetical protein
MYCASLLTWAALLLSSSRAALSFSFASAGGVLGAVFFYLIARTRKKLFTTYETPLVLMNLLAIMLVFAPVLFLRLPFEFAKLKLLLLSLAAFPIGAAALLIFLLERREAARATLSVLAGVALASVAASTFSTLLPSTSTIFASAFAAILAFTALFPSIGGALLATRRIKRTSGEFVTRLRLGMIPVLLAALFAFLFNSFTGGFNPDMRVSADTSVGQFIRSSAAGYSWTAIEASPCASVEILARKDDPSSRAFFASPSGFLDIESKTPADPLIELVSRIAHENGANRRMLALSLPAAWSVRSVIGEGSRILEERYSVASFFKDSLSFPSSTLEVAISGLHETAFSELARLGPDSFDFFYADISQNGLASGLLSIEGLKLIRERVNSHGFVAIRAGSRDEAARVALSLARLAERDALLADEILNRLFVFHTARANPYLVVWLGDRAENLPILEKAVSNLPLEALGGFLGPPLKPLDELRAVLDSKSLVRLYPSLAPPEKPSNPVADVSFERASLNRSAALVALAFSIFLAVLLALVELELPAGLKTRAYLGRALASSAMHGLLASFLFGPFLFAGGWSYSRLVAGLACFIVGAWFTRTVLHDTSSSLLYSTALAAFLFGYGGAFIFPPSYHDELLPFGLMLVFATLMVTSFNFSLTIKLLSNLHPMQFLWVLVTYGTFLLLGALAFPALASTIKQDGVLLSGLFLYLALFYYFYTVRDFELLETLERNEESEN